MQSEISAQQTALMRAAQRPCGARFTDLSRALKLMRLKQDVQDAIKKPGGQARLALLTTR